MSTGSDRLASNGSRLIHSLPRLAAFYYLSVGACLCLVVASSNATGLQANIIDSSSMSPAIERGSVLLSRAPTDQTNPTVNDVLVFDRGDRIIAHRIVRVEANELITRSDSTTDYDQYRVSNDDVVGIGRAAIPYIGWPALWFDESTVRFTVWALITATASMLAGSSISKRGQRPATRSERTRIRVSPRPTVVALAATPLLASLLVTLPLPTASGEYTGTTQNASNSWTTGPFSLHSLLSFGQDRPAGLMGATLSTPYGLGSESWSAIDNGQDHMCGIRNDGTLWCRGSNSQGQLGDDSTTDRALTPVGGDTRWSSIEAGTYHSCSVKQNGTLWCWGDNANGKLGDGTTTDTALPIQIGADTDWNNLVVAGGDHSCATKADGTLWCWGDNLSGQLGDGTNTDRYTPIQVNTDTDWTSISGKWDTTCGVKTDGTLWCWGENGSRQLGDGSTTDRNTPTQTGTDTDWAVVDSNRYHTCGIKVGGTLWCWGTNTYGRLGDGTTTTRTTPTQIGADTDWSTINTNRDHTCGTKTSGTLWCWGANSYGQLGDGTFTGRKSPTQVGTDTDWSSTTGGRSSTCATKTNGTLWCWGDNLSHNLATSPDYLPATVQHWSSIDGGFQHSCGVDSGGQLWCWGNGTSGQIGDGTSSQQESPVLVGVDTDWAVASAGGFHSCGIKSGGTLWCWGFNGNGRLGDGTTTTRDSPVQIGSETNWASVDLGRNHSCGTKTDGTLWCWGYNVHGAIGDGTTSPRTTPTQVGTDTDWALVASSFQFTCGLKTGGTLWCWGYNGYSNLGDGTTTKRLSPVQIGSDTTWRDVSTGIYLGCGTRTDDTLWCWGANDFGQLGDGTTTTRTTPTQIGTGYKTAATGDSYACAINTSEELLCWGRNNHGQLGLGTTTNHSSPQPVALIESVSSMTIGDEHTMVLASPATPTYQYLGLAAGWAAARDLAEAHGGKLIEVNDATENTFVKDTYGHNLYLNATDEVTEGVWLNTDGDPLTYTNWNAGEPNNWDNAQHWTFMLSSGKWDDTKAGTTLRRTVVEYGP